MARIPGRQAALYMNLTSSGTAEPVAYLNNWDISFTTDKIEVTAFGDTNKVYVSGLPDASGSYAGFYDTATPQAYTAASDGVARKMYLYPDRTTAGTYWWGTALFDFQVSVGVGDAAAISGSFAGASPIIKVG